jgi:tetratricopeptide (TPR) repeat protein
LTGENIRHILTSPCIASYYPVRSLTLALDYEIWGLNPAGFKLTGGLLHLTNVLLVFWLLARMLRGREAAEGQGDRQRGLDAGAVAVATFSAGVFAVHPVVVEPVTWVAGREELLMTLGALGCVHFHLAARQPSGEGGGSRRAACLVGAAFCCAFGCLSNALGAVIPLLVTAWDVLTLPSPKPRRILRGTAALWIIAAATVTVKVLLPSGPQADLPWAILVRQPGVVLAGYWLNLRTLAWPTGLAFSHEFIPPDDLPLAQVALGALAAVATCGLIWIVRGRTLVLYGLVWFCLALAPASQLMPHHLQRADRFLYLPLVGLAVGMGTAMVRLRPLVKGRPAVMASAAAAGVGVLLLLDMLATRQVQNWRDEVTLWEHCVAVEPNNPRAHGYLAGAYENAGEADRARASYRKSLQLAPNLVWALNDFAIFLTSDDAPRLDDHRLAVELAERGCRLTEWRDPDLTLTLARARTALANTHAAAGEFGLAIDHYYKAIEAHAEYDLPLFNLAILLSTCRDESLRDPEQAVRLAEQGCRLGGPPDAHRASILATAYGEAGRFEEAVDVLQKAIKAARTRGDTNDLEQLRGYLDRLQNHVPLTAPPDAFENAEISSWRRHSDTSLYRPNPTTTVTP